LIVVPKRRRKKVEQNPLSKGAKVAVIGGIALAGGAAALFLTKPAAAAQTGPAAPAVDPLQAKAQECAALQSSLAQLRSRPTPDAREVARLEQQVAACIAQSRELGAPVDNATAQQSTGDQSYQTAEAKYAEYKGTEYFDALKRNNLRQDVLRAGAGAATAYAAAVTAATTDEAVQLVRLSILRALDAAVQRRVCYYLDQPGCGRLGVNEDHSNDKADQEKAQVINPLIAAHNAAIEKLGGAGALRIPAGIDKLVSASVRGAQATKTWLDQKFNEYKSVDLADAARRNNLRQEILTKGAFMVGLLEGAFAESRRFMFAPGLRLTATATMDALNASIDRYLCFRSGTGGCGTFAVNEDQPNVKAQQEYDRITDPLLGLYRRIADALVESGDASLFPLLAGAKLRLALYMADAASAKFAEYTSTENDPLKRGNQQADILANAADAAARLQDALAVAVAGANAKPSVTTQIAKAIPAFVVGPKSTGDWAKVASTLAVRPTVPTATSGLGQFPNLKATLASFRPAGVASMIIAPADHLGAIRAVAAGIQKALDSAVSRKLCHQYGGKNCGGDDDANKEQTRVIAPLLASSRVAAKFLSDKGDAQAEAPFVNITIRELNAARDYMGRQWSSLKTTDYIDQLKRNNLRGDIVRAGQRAVGVLRAAKPATDAGKASLRAVAGELLKASKDREACYRAGASGCGRIDDGGDASARLFVPGYAVSPREADNDTKANQEANEIGKPLAALVADKAALAGLGDADGGIPSWVWWGAGIGVAAMVYAHTRPSRPVRTNRRVRRTSRARTR
jgi:hypothetical protein